MAPENLGSAVSRETGGDWGAMGEVGRTADFEPRNAVVCRQRVEGLCTIVSGLVVCLSFWRGVAGGRMARRRGTCDLVLVLVPWRDVAVWAAGLLTAGRSFAAFSGY